MAAGAAFSASRRTSSVRILRVREILVLGIRGNWRVERYLRLLPACLRLDTSSFFRGVWADASDGGQVVDTLIGAIGFVHLQDFFGGGWADAGN
jgi:hypothetical protein